MEIIKGNLTFVLEHPTAVVLGNFDGIHKGHLELLRKAMEFAGQERLKSTFFTFEPHPSFVLAHKEQVDLIYTAQEKMKVVEELGMDYYVEFPFNEEVASMEAQVFVEKVLVEQVKARCIVVGADYRFGRRRMGDVHMLEELSRKHGYTLVVMEKLADHEREISSTLLRQAIREGDIILANELMGRPYFVRGDVRTGMRIGRTIGIPTANLIPPREKLLPPYGVYHTEVTVDGVMYQGLTNIGTNPTVGGEGIKVETFLLDFEGDLYGKTLDLEFLEYLRPEVKFTGLAAMRTQIGKDIDYVIGKVRGSGHA
ncbi:bifunctional riboflavin kinase/FAD synthetase [Anaerotalea alkaliphila]|uniref:Riboflavin biosynthesis protein n=1 Tax=Anaerotalea alkaliphila TaxID=2662126 RepID=A0A7X5HTG2_9FIRM|nr:bifunctional riboflavin kinase/FAD synthetase [Anaerotalea alkaliphila]NDL66324.1 bifunctional riboflavin kinase/FAD synthetase [Anaerotalea alkaliphila]